MAENATRPPAEIGLQLQFEKVELSEVFWIFDNKKKRIARMRKARMKYRLTKVSRQGVRRTAS